MTLAVFPAALGEPLAAGFTLSPKERNVTAAMKRGTTRARTQSEGDVYVIKCSLRFKTKKDQAAFIVFFQNTISYGDDWFKADWFTGIGFTANTWAFKFVDFDDLNFAYKSGYEVSILMALDTEVEQPGTPWPTSELDPGFLDDRFGCISPASEVLSGTSTTVFDLDPGEVLRARWRVGWVLDFFNLQTGVQSSGPHTIQSVNGDEITLVAPAPATPTDVLGIRFSEYNNVDVSQKKYAFITDGTNNFPDAGKPYSIMFG